MNRSKNIRKLILICMVLNLMLFSAVLPSYAATGMTVQASSSSYTGVKNVVLGNDYTSENLIVQPQNAAGAAITDIEGMYPAFEKLCINYKNAVTGGMYMLFISDENTGSLSTEHLCDVVQVKAESSDITFTSYPSLQIGKTYYAYMSSSTPSETGLTYNAPTLAFSFQYALCDVTRGDVDNSGSVDNADAQMILDYLVGAPGITFEGEALTMADFDMNGTVDAADAMAIMQYYDFVSHMS